MHKSLWQKAWPHVTIILLFLVVAAVYCKPALQGKVLQQSDIVQWKSVSHQSFEYKDKYGHFPLWTNSIYSGMPAYQVAMQRTSAISLDYFNSLLTLGLPRPVSFFFLACLMFYILCLAVRVNPWIAGSCALAYAYSTFDPIIIAVGHDSQMLSIAYAPGLLAGLFILYNRQYLWGTALTLIFSGLLIAQSHQQIVYYTLLTAGCAGMAYLVACIREKQVRHYIIANALALAGIAGGFASNAMGYLTTYEFSKESMRSGKSEITTNADGTAKPKGGLDKSYAFHWSYGIGETMTLMVPGLYGGGSGGREISASGEFPQKLVEAGQPEDNAVQFANAYAYWGPQPGTSGPVYLGAVICMLFIAGLFIVPGWQKWWMAAAVVLAVFMSWGSNFAVFNNFLFDHFPFYNKFRAPTMALVIPQLAFPLLAAMALQRIFIEAPTAEGLWKQLKPAAYVTAGLLALLLIFWLSADYTGQNDAKLKESFTSSMLQQAQGKQPSPEMQQQAGQFGLSLIHALQQDRKSLTGKDLVRSIVLIVISALLIGAFIRKKITARIAMAAVLLLASFDVLAVGRRYLNDDNFVDASDYEGNFAPNAADATILADPGYYRVFDQTAGDPFADARASYFHNSLGGYLAARLGLYQDLMDNQLRKGNRAVFNMLNTKWIIQQNPASGQPVAVQNPDAFGPCWLVSQIGYVKDGNAAMKALDSVNLRSVAVVEDQYKNQVTSAPQLDSAATLRLVRNSNDTIVYQFSAAAPQFAVFSEIYYDKGWNAYLDGKPAGYLRVDYALRGMPVPAGKHDIEFRFEPTLYKLGNTLALVASLAAYLLLLVAIIAAWRKRQTSV